MDIVVDAVEEAALAKKVARLRPSWGRLRICKKMYVKNSKETQPRESPEVSGLVHGFLIKISILFNSFLFILIRPSAVLFLLGYQRVTLARKREF